MHRLQSRHFFLTTYCRNIVFDLAFAVQVTGYIVVGLWMAVVIVKYLMKK